MGWEEGVEPPISGSAVPCIASVLLPRANIRIYLSYIRIRGGVLKKMCLDEGTTPVHGLMSLILHTCLEVQLAQVIPDLDVVGFLLGPSGHLADCALQVSFGLQVLGDAHAMTLLLQGGLHDLACIA